MYAMSANKITKLAVSVLAFNKYFILYTGAAVMKML